MPVLQRPLSLAPTARVALGRLGRAATLAFGAAIATASTGCDEKRPAVDPVPSATATATATATTDTTAAAPDAAPAPTTFPHEPGQALRCAAGRERLV